MSSMEQIKGIVLTTLQEKLNHPEGLVLCDKSPNNTIQVEYEVEGLTIIVWFIATEKGFIYETSIQSKPLKFEDNSITQPLVRLISKLTALSTAAEQVIKMLDRYYLLELKEKERNHVGKLVAELMKDDTKGTYRRRAYYGHPIIVNRTISVGLEEKTYRVTLAGGYMHCERIE